MTEVLTVDQVKTLLQCSDKTVRARAHELGGLKFGVDWVFPAQALHQRLVEMALQGPQKGPEPQAAPTPAAVLHQPQQQPAAGRRQGRSRPKLPDLRLLAQGQGVSS